MTHTTIVSAPGKVLLTGGYLVLDPAFSGLVVATDARFYTLIRPAHSPRATATSPFRITVRSPQFQSATWTYWVHIHGKEVQVAPSNEDESRNTFVELALVYSLGMMGHLIPTERMKATLDSGLEIVIAGNNDFYSQRKELDNLGLPLTADSLKQIPLFASTHTTLSKVNKTGLGSSAALITSLVAALFTHFKVQDSNPKDTLTHKQFLHNAAQFVHCLAQGKVGSGFDVSSAVWGSHTYRRFRPELLQEVMNHDAKNDIPGLLKVLDPSQTKWDNEVVPFQLAPRLHLMLADIDAGSHTPTLVSNVLKWRKNKPEEANGLWDHLGAANDRVVALLKELDQMSKDHPKDYALAVEKASEAPATSWEGLVRQSILGRDATMELLVKIYEEFQSVRRYLREMSELSEVPVEPKEQSRLLDACLEIPGVLMAGVPGAGGFDAIFCIVLSDAAREAVAGVWSGFEEMSVGPLLCTESVDGGLVVELSESVATTQTHSATVQRLLSL
ncbi:phosphomevalonate kinase [Entomortierella parvispora]|uniref:Phosphomevalonate kinase n=1 Tax=Entomortierella parvispora TaxID=205924 RepID=A0A9P3M0R3_9FUNG|nr:phosphomevalonate kinase [Entomortierella parvispora]